ncbi:translation initiation factor IF-2 N-terminal domain-containing protein [Pseudonocardia phyllosphaerae]|uniref:translation initiation factor IF-2 N-terminal domain-containing protein n=1 Tax=Pseudonocardia phyllosphaerae TaxID=3390502 RepID=UPI003977F43E
MTTNDAPAGTSGGSPGVSDPAANAAPDLPEKMRVHALAKLLGRASREVLSALSDLGQEVRSVQSSITRATAEQVVAALAPVAGETAAPAATTATVPVGAEPAADADVAEFDAATDAAAPATGPSEPAAEESAKAKRTRKGGKAKKAAGSPFETPAAEQAGSGPASADAEKTGPEATGPEKTDAGSADEAGRAEETAAVAASLTPTFAVPMFQAPTAPAAPAKPAERTETPETGSDDAADSGDEGKGGGKKGRKRNRRRAEEQAPAEETTPAEDTTSGEGSEDGEQADSGEGDPSDDESNRRRRRRGRRGRGRGKGGDEQGENDSDESDDDSDDSSSDTRSGSGADESDDDSNGSDSESDDSDSDSDDGSDDDRSQGGSSGSRRRRRRRRRGGSDSDSSTDDDPPNTVTKVREARQESSSDDQVQGVRGSTRLEAKRQRRRDGRDAGRRRPPILSESEFLARRESVDRKMVIRQQSDRTEIGVLEDDVLVEHFITGGNSGAGSMVGNIYLGRVQNVLPSMEAAFVDIGRGRNAVLYAGEVNWDAAGLNGKARKIEQALSSGDQVLVQVTKDPVGHKGARLTTQISLAGRFLVYVPSGGAAGISRKLPDNERKRLKEILKEIVPSEAGVIIRTASEGVSHESLERDVRRLQAQWEVVKEKSEKTGKGAPKAPTLLYEEPDMLVKVVRDQFNEDFSTLIVSGDSAWETVSGYVDHVAPELADRMHRHTGPRDVFTEYRIDEQLTKALDRKVWLPSGGTLVIDRTEAMTVVDVNTGKFTGSGGNLEETVTRNNLEAAEEVVRQLRLRDIGGIIVVDFIDMVLEANRDLVLRRLTECLARDRTRHQVAEVTSLGLVQMTRKRVGGGLLEHFSTPCEHCRGRGVIVSTESDHQHGGGGNNGSGNNGNGNNGNGAQGNGQHNGAQNNGGNNGNGDGGGRRRRRRGGGGGSGNGDNGSNGHAVEAGTNGHGANGNGNGNRDGSGDAERTVETTSAAAAAAVIAGSLAKDTDAAAADTTSTGARDTDVDATDTDVTVSGAEDSGAATSGSADAGATDPAAADSGAAGTPSDGDAAVSAGETAPAGTTVTEAAPAPEPAADPDETEPGVEPVTTGAVAPATTGAVGAPAPTPEPASVTDASEASVAPEPAAEPAPRRRRVSRSAGAPVRGADPVVITTGTTGQRPAAPTAVPSSEAPAQPEPEAVVSRPRRSRRAASRPAGPPQDGG